MKEEAQAAEVIKCAGQKSDVVGIKIGNKEGCVDLGGAAAELLSRTSIMRSKQRVGRWELRRKKCGGRRRRRGDRDV